MPRGRIIVIEPLGIHAITLRQRVRYGFHFVEQAGRENRVGVVKCQGTGGAELPP